MIVTALENVVLFSTAFTVIGFSVAWAARHGVRRGLIRLRPRTLARLLTVALVVPCLAAVWLVAASLLPASWLGGRDFRAAHGASHEIHLVGNLTADLEPHLGHAVLLLVAGIAVLVAWSTVRGYRRLAGAVAHLQLRATPPPADQLSLVETIANRRRLSVGLVQSDHPLSFVWGVRRPKLVLSSGLLASLTPAELTAVIEHEAAHHARRDNLMKMVLNVCAHASLVAPLGRLLLRWRSEQVELVCDEAAAMATGEPLDVAAALLKVSRRIHPATLSPVLRTSVSSFVPDEQSVERRVRHLVALTETVMTRPPVSGRGAPRTMIFISSLFVLSLVGLTAWAPLVVHAAIESLFQSLR